MNMPIPLDEIVKKAKGAGAPADDGEAYDASREDGVALTKKLFKAWERRDAEDGYDLICQIVALKGGAPHETD
jgi:hypothetical protein